MAWNNKVAWSEGMFLRDLVDTFRPNWRWRASGRTSPGIPNRLLQRFRRAATIRAILSPLAAPGTGDTL